MIILMHLCSLVCPHVVALWVESNRCFDSYSYALNFCSQTIIRGDLRSCSTLHVLNSVKKSTFEVKGNNGVNYGLV